MTKRNLFGLAILCSVLLTAGACGGKTGDKASKGSKASGKSGKTGAAGLIGTWKLNGKKSVEANEMFKKFPKEAQAKIIAKMDKATVTITKDTMIMDGLGPKQKDKYKVLSDKGQTVEIESTDEKGKVEKATYTFVSGSEIKITAKEGKETMTFFADRQ